jgi:accessory colonization factor AcfC
MEHERHYTALWGMETGTKKNNVRNITLNVVSAKENENEVSVFVTFNNSKECAKVMNAEAHSAF